MAIQYQIYFRQQGGSWVYQGNTYNTYFYVSGLSEALRYFQIYEWRVDTHDDITGLTTTGDTWTFTTIHSSSFPYGRRSDYDEDVVWDPGTEDWSSDEDLIIAGGGRYKQRIVVVGHKKIYFGDM